MKKPDLQLVNLDHRIPIESLIEYRNRGLTYRQIAKLVGCSKQNVHERLQAIAYDKGNLDNFKKNRADIFALMQSRLINSLDGEAVKAMQPYQRVVASSILYDKERLERGQSTENINIHQITASLHDLQEQRNQLLQSIQ